MVTLFSGVAYWGLKLPDTVEFVDTELVLKDPDFSEYEGGFRHLLVNSLEMRQNDTTKINRCTVVDAVFFDREDPDFRANLKSMAAIKDGEKPLVFSGNVIVKTTNDDTLLTQELLYHSHSQRFESLLPVEIFRPGMRGLADAMNSQPRMKNGHLNGHVRLQFDEAPGDPVVKVTHAELQDVFKPASLTLFLDLKIDPKALFLPAPVRCILIPKPLAEIFDGRFWVPPPHFFRTPQRRP